ncbi:MAG TPA: penicillin-binding protein 2 [Clostridiales bacterium]|nr:penicillin-binding protein 2 [Clostridiales bacterium]
MKYLKRNIRSALIVLLGLFVILTVYFYYNLFLYSDRWFSDPNNTRVKVDMTNPSIIPGSISDRNGKVLVETRSYKNDNGALTYYRSYHKDSRYAAHVIGSKKYGIGAEALYVRYLLGYDNNLFERIYQKAFLDQEVGNDVILTIDMRLQKFISQAMGKSKGSVVLMNPNSGEILALVSQPSFNPSADNEDPADESLLNKASYGRFTPGSIMKVITAAAALESMENLNDYVVECKGSTEINGFIIKCYDGEAHGQVNLSRAMEVSCNAYFAQLSLDVGWKQLKKTAEKFGFNKDFLFSDIKTSKSELPINHKTDAEELAWSGIGQGKVLVTPLHMALVASAIANKGIMPEPRLIYGIQPRSGKIRLQGHSKLADATTPEIAQTLTNMMVNVVENGTGSRARTKGMLIAGKTGTAEVGSDKNPHAWFIGFAPADHPTLAIAVILENSGTGGSKAAPLAGSILREAARLGY